MSMLSPSSSISPAKDACLDQITSLFLPDSVWIFLYNLHHRIAVLLSPGLFQQESLTLYVVVIFYVFLMGGEPSILLLHHLYLSSSSIF